MEDAVTSSGDQMKLQIEQVTNNLKALKKDVDFLDEDLDFFDADLTNLHDTVQDLKEQLRVMQLSIALQREVTHIIILLAIVAGLGYMGHSLKEMVFQSFTEAIFENIIIFMLFMAANCFWGPFRVSVVQVVASLFRRIYPFRVSQEIPKETTDDVRESNDNEFSRADEEAGEDKGSVSATYGSESNETRMHNKKAVTLNVIICNTKVPSTKESPPIDFLIPSEAEIEEAKEDAKSKAFPSEVHSEVHL